MGTNFWKKQHLFFLLLLLNCFSNLFYIKQKYTFNSFHYFQMNNFNNRVNQLYTFSTTLTFILLGLNAATRPILQNEPIIDFKFDDVIGFRRNFGSGGDAALLSFDLAVDLTPMWNWNTKEVFLYVFAEYKTPKNAVNQVMLWDRIIADRDDAVFDEKAIRAEYILTDQGYHLRDRELQFKVGWSITPIAGALYRGNSEPVAVT